MDFRMNTPPLFEPWQPTLVAALEIPSQTIPRQFLRVSDLLRGHALGNNVAVHHPLPF